MENTQNPPFLHVKRENTRKTGTKMVENTLFSQIDKILKIYPRLDEYISFPFVPGSRTGFNPLYGHILVSSKGDQTYYSFCGRRCKTKRGLHIHMASCDRQHGLTDEAFTIEGIDATFGTPECRWYRVQWEGYKGADTWEPERSLVRQGCEDSIKAFWSRSKHSPCEDFIADPDNVWRCWSCGRGYKTASALSAHITRTHSQRQWRCTTAAIDAQTKLYREEQKKKEKAVCEGEEIDNVWQFVYLGSRFQADGDQVADIKARIALATSTAGKMRGVWAAKTVPLSLKMRIYKTGVCSRLIYGSEGWKLTARACAMLNGANSRMVSRITGKSAHEEASVRTRTFDVVASIRARRLQWVGHILRTKSDNDGNHRMVYKAVRYIYDNRQEGDLLMDAPDTREWDALVKLAADRKRWRQMVYKVRGGEVSGSTNAASSKTDKVERFNLKMPQRVDATAAVTAEAKATAAYRARDQREMFLGRDFHDPEEDKREDHPLDKPIPA